MLNSVGGNCKNGLEVSGCMSGFSKLKKNADAGSKPERSAGPADVVELSPEGQAAAKGQIGGIAVGSEAQTPDLSLKGNKINWKI
ncbi:MAG: hypothetical protein JW745_02235 [Sedimentisphaerales bacterium]|nr:hypothetical protein [Sedimentisphaerales bacterium]MBN2841861.1 hypothetical protein [Sedimentisphaerales bacterium]